MSIRVKPRRGVDTGWLIRVITKLPNTEQSFKGKVKTHKSTNRQNQSTTGKLEKPQWPWLGTGISKEMVGWIRFYGALPPTSITVVTITAFETILGNIRYNSSQHSTLWKSIGFHSFPVVDWFCLFVDLWVLPFPLEDCSVFGNFGITRKLFLVTAILEMLTVSWIEEATFWWDDDYDI